MQGNVRKIWVNGRKIILLLTAVGYVFRKEKL